MRNVNQAALRRVSFLPYQKLEDEVLVVDPRTREVHLLNQTATRIWELLETAHTADELVAVLTEEFDAPTESLRVDVETLLADLGAKGLVGLDASLDQPDLPGPTAPSPAMPGKVSGEPDSHV